MKFFCEYCGSRIDAEKHDKCPNCGAKYNLNKTYIKLAEEKNKREEKKNELEDEIVEHKISTFKISRIVFIILLIIFFVIFGIILTGIITRNKSDLKPSNIEEEKIIESEVYVNLNEYGATSDYKATVTKYELTHSFMNYTFDDYEYVKFYLLVENISDTQIRSENVNCIVDGIAQENDYYSGYSTLPFFIDKGLTVEGTATFKVPKNATSYDIKYGDYITIHVEK